VLCLVVDVEEPVVKVVDGGTPVTSFDDCSRTLPLPMVFGSPSTSASASAA